MNLFKVYECTGNCELFGFPISNSSVCQLIPLLLTLLLLTTISIILFLGIKWIYRHSYIQLKDD
jgi:hypothetical protein